MKEKIISLVKLPDSISSKIYLKLFKEKNSLITFLLHGLFLDNTEKNLDLVDSQTWITLEEFNQFVEYFLENDYTFISPEDVLNGLNVDKKYIMITFDDGYYNNHLALPILKKYNVPATFFISTNHVKLNKCFWWDVLYREMKKSGESIKKIIQEQKMLKNKTNIEIENYLVNRFGEKSFIPKGDIDRPFNPLELREFSKENLVFLGNHTCDHSILTNYTKDLIKSQILNAQKTINDITGKTPIIISYPDGAISDEIVKISKEVGLKLGITTIGKKNYFPIDHQDNKCMLLGRFNLSGSKNIINQCELFRSDILLYTRFWNYLKKR